MGNLDIIYEYDEKSKSVVTTFIDSDGCPIVVSVEYATVKKTYDDVTRKIETEMYFDEKEEAIFLVKVNMA